MLLAEPISDSSTQYMDFVQMFNGFVYRSFLVGVELPLYVVVTAGSRIEETTF